MMEIPRRIRYNNNYVGTRVGDFLNLSEASIDCACFSNGRNECLLHVAPSNEKCSMSTPKDRLRVRGPVKSLRR